MRKEWLDMAELPKSRIVIRDGLVQLVEEWVFWGRFPANTLLIKRTPKGFSSIIGDPEHGGRLRDGETVSDVTGGLHKDIRSGYEKLFNMRDVNFDEVQKMYPNHVIVFE